MYKLFYGLAEAPFNLTPDSKFLYLSRGHDEALNALRYGVSERKGFICVTGEIGSGKTTTLRALLSQLDEESYSVATILNSYLTDLELLKTINEEFGLSGKSDSKKALLDELNAFLVEQYRQGRNCVLILDESQNLRPETLEQIRMISNLETETDKLIQIVMVGQPELRRTLELPELEQLNQRITVRYHVGPLEVEEVPKYIYHRLKVARAQEEIEFSPQALRLIYHYSKGIPRRINVICDRCLLVGYVLARFDIDGDMVQQAVDEIRGVTQPRRPEVAAIQETEHHRSGWRLSRQNLLMALAGAGIVLFGFLAGMGFRSLTQGEASKAAPVSMAIAGEAVWTEAERAPAANPAPAPALPAMPEAAPMTPEPDELPGVAGFPMFAGDVPDGAEPALGVESEDEAAEVEPELELEEARSVVTAPVPPGFPAWTPDPEGVVRVDRAEHALAASYVQLLRQWGIEVDLEPFAAAPPEEVAMYDMRAMVGQLAFRTYTTRELDSALRLDLPILIRMASSGEDRAPVAAVLRQNGDHVAIADPRSGLRETAIEELKKEAVEATIIYHDPEKLTGLKSGDRGPAVEALQRALAATGAADVKVDGLFGPQVRQAVRDFQRTAGIAVNGRVDAPTAAALIGRTGDDPPRLNS
jgi:general secretion pathway protein A